MTSQEAPESLRLFILENIDSVEQLRVLLLLHEDAQKEWTLATLSKELRSTESSIEKRLNALYEKKILCRNDQPFHRYVPCTPKLGELITELAQFHAQRPYSVIDLIYARPNEAIRGFADAFKIKRTKDDG